MTQWAVALLTTQIACSFPRKRFIVAGFFLVSELDLKWLRAWLA